MSEQDGAPRAENPDTGEQFSYPRDGGNYGPIVIANEFADVVVVDLRGAHG